MSEAKSIAILASGSGSNFEAIAQAIDQGKVRLNLSLLICDREGAGVIERAKKIQNPNPYPASQRFSSREDFDAALLEALQKRQIEWVVLAGFMRILGKNLIRAYPNRILNIHPSLLPRHPGLHAIRKAFEAKDRETGVTVHFVDEGMDTGPVIAQKKVEILSTDRLETLEARIHAAEHVLYPEVLTWLAQGRLEVKENRVIIQDKSGKRNS